MGVNTFIWRHAHINLDVPAHLIELVPDGAQR